MKLKKILAVFLACCLSLSFLMIPVSASPLNTPRNIIRFYSDVSNLYNDYSSGGMSKSEFLEKFSSSMVRFDINYAADVTCFKDVLKVIEFCGFDVPDSWTDWFYENKMGGDGGGGHRDDSILNGFGAVCICYNGNGGLEYTCYSAYGIIYKQLTNQIVAYADSEKIVHRVFSTGYVDDNNDCQVIGYLDKSFSSNTYVFYGDWRYDDGSDTSDLVNDLPEKQIPPYDDDSVPEDDIDDFLADLLEELLNKFPDTSTIEGLLRSILSKLDSLDKDDDNALLSQILTAIEALKKEEEKTEEEEEKKDLSELLALLQELRDAIIYVDPDDDTITFTVSEILHNSLIYKDKETSSTVAEMLHDIQKNQITIKNFEIDESLFNQRFALIQAKLLGKFSFIPEVKNFVEYALDSYANTSSCPSISVTIFGSTHFLDFSAFEEHIDLIRFCVAAFFYLSFAFSIFRKIPGYINGGDNT